VGASRFTRRLPPVAFVFVDCCGWISVFVPVAVETLACESSGEPPVHHCTLPALFEIVIVAS
jgi:hypothetical protein